jgi:hypothetical protein
MTGLLDLVLRAHGGVGEWYASGTPESPVRMRLPYVVDLLVRPIGLEPITFGSGADRERAFRAS